MPPRWAAPLIAAVATCAGAIGATPGPSPLALPPSPGGGTTTVEHVDVRNIPLKSPLPGLDGPLTNLVRQATSTATLAEAGQATGVEVRGDRVQVMVEARPGELDAARRSVAGAGGAVQLEYEHLLQIEAPVAGLEQLAVSPGVALVRRPAQPQAAAIISEGVPTMGLEEWYANGLRGAGAKVAILDLGFDGYWNILGTEFSPNPVIRSFRADGDITGSGDTHGTAAAEVAYDVAPEATYYLVNFATEAELGAAVDWLITEHVNVVSSSVGWPGTAYGDGKGSVNGIVAKAEQGGITWVQAAGNYGNTHWTGYFTDTDGNGFHAYRGTDEGLTIHLRRSSPTDERVFRVEIYLTWDDWDTLSQDYDLFLFRGDAVVAQSTAFQNGQFPPVEHIVYTTAAAGDYWIGVQRFRTTRRSKLDLLVTSDFDMEYREPAESLVIPADSPAALTVGAAAPGTVDVRPYSSRGPTKDGRPKPDLVAADQVTTLITGPQGFTGTSASAPQVAGAAALYVGARPGATPARVRDFLRSRAVGGSPGNTNVGYGRVFLGSLPAAASLPIVTRGAFLGSAR